MRTLYISLICRICLWVREEENLLHRHLGFCNSVNLVLRVRIALQPCAVQSSDNLQLDDKQRRLLERNGGNGQHLSGRIVRNIKRQGEHLPVQCKYIPSLEQSHEWQQFL